MAATLWSAPEGLVSYETAAELWDFEGIRSRQVHLTIPGRRSLRSARLSLHHTSELLPADVAMSGPIRVTSPLRTAIDIAGVVDPQTFEIALESALRRRLFSPGQLRWRSETLLGPGRPGSSTLRRLLDARGLGGSDSGWEVKVAQMLEAAGLGTPVRQHPVRLSGRVVARLDLAYPDALVAIEYDSDRWHSGVARRHADAERRNRLRALGWTVIEITPDALRHPVDLVRLVATVLAA